MNDVAAGDPIVLGLMTLCVDGASTGEVTAVDAIGDGSIDVTGFAVVNGPGAVGAARSTLVALGLGPDAHSVSAACRPAGTPPAQLQVEVVRSTAVSAMVTGFRVHWSADGSRGSFVITFPNWLCAPGDPSGSSTCLPSS